MAAFLYHYGAAAFWIFIWLRLHGMHHGWWPGPFWPWWPLH